MYKHSALSLAVLDWPAPPFKYSIEVNKMLGAFGMSIDKTFKAFIGFIIKNLLVIYLFSDNLPLKTFSQLNNKKE